MNRRHGHDEVAAWCNWLQGHDEVAAWCNWLQGHDEVAAWCNWLHGHVKMTAWCNWLHVHDDVDAWCYCLLHDEVAAWPRGAWLCGATNWMVTTRRLRGVSDCTTTRWLHGHEVTVWWCKWLHDHEMPLWCSGYMSTRWTLCAAIVTEWSRGGQPRLRNGCVRRVKQRHIACLNKRLCCYYTRREKFWRCAWGTTLFCQARYAFLRWRCARACSYAIDSRCGHKFCEHEVFRDVK